jgi:hypothetical protein
MFDVLVWLGCCLAFVGGACILDVFFYRDKD